MKLNTLIWDETKIVHIKPPKRKGVKYEDIIWKNCTVRVINDTLYVNEYSSAQGVSTGRSLVLDNPKLTHLQSWCMVIEADWVETINVGTKKEKTFRHRVAVSASF